MNKFTFKKQALFLAALLAGVLVFPVSVLAQSDKLQDALKNVDEKVQEVEKTEQQQASSTPAAPEASAETKIQALPEDVAKTQAQDSDAASPALTTQTTLADEEAQKEQLSEEQIKELKAKKEALISVIDFSIIEVQDLESKTEDLLQDTQDLKIKNTASSNLEVLSSRLNHLEELQAQVQEKDITLKAIQAIAFELKAWRENIYNPEVKNSLDLAIVGQAESIITKTQARLEKVSQDVAKIENIVEGSPLSPLLKEANTEFEKAQWYFGQARDQVAAAANKRLEIFDKLDKDLAQIIADDAASSTSSIENDSETEMSGPTEEDVQAEFETALQENNKAIETTHKAAQLYAEKISQHIKGVYSTLIEMSKKAKAELSK